MKRNRYLRELAAAPAFLLLASVDGDGDAGGGGGGAPAAEPWYGKDADPETKQWIEKNGFKGNADVIKTAMHQEKLIGVPKEQLLRLPADRAPDKLGDVFAQLGKPKDIAGYDVKPNAEIGLDGPALENFLKVGHEKAHLLDWQVKALISDWYEPMMKQLGEQAEGDKQKSYEEGEAKIKEMFGDAYEERVGRINALLAEHGDGDLDEYLLQTGRGNDPRFAKFLDKIAQLVAEPGKLPGEQGRDTTFGGRLTPAEAQNKLIEFERVNHDALINRSHADHAHLVKEREKLIAQAYPAPR
ncbi:MAG: hypothetical protein BroJett013_30490 [Alphaproteobacteria bacterium]|nr:MAG: hypothetical protein BroJett013_30490 [Alphaproteobacteria bacterium]